MNPKQDIKQKKDSQNVVQMRPFTDFNLEKATRTLMHIMDKMESQEKDSMNFARPSNPDDINEKTLKLGSLIDLDAEISVFFCENSDTPL